MSLSVGEVGNFSLDDLFDFGFSFEELNDIKEEEDVQQTGEVICKYDMAYRGKILLALPCLIITKFYANMQVQTRGSQNLQSLRNTRDVT